MKKFLIVFALVIIIPIIGLFSFLMFANFNNYKPQIENMIKKYANLDVKINGDLEVAFSLKPNIELNDVSISKPENNQKIAQIGNAVIKFSIIPLLKKEIVADTVETSNTNIYTSEKDYVTINSLKVEMDDFNEPVSVIFDTVVSGISVDGYGVLSSFKDIQQSDYNNTNIDAHINAMGYNLHYQGRLNDMKSNFNTQGKYDLTYKTTKINGNVSVEMKGTTPAVKIDVNSDLINVNDFTAKNISYNSFLISSAMAEEFISGTTIPYSYLKMVDADVTINFKKVKVEDVEIQDFDGDFNLQNGVLKANVKKAKTMGVQINGFAKIDSPRNKPYIKLNIQGNELDLNKLMKKNTSTSNKNKISFMDLFISTAEASELMPNTIIPYQYLKMVDADINADIKKIVVDPNTTITNVKADANIKNGALKANIKNASVGGGTVNGVIGLNAQNKTASVNLKGSNIILQEANKAFSNSANKELYIKSGGKTDFNVNINTSGSNTDQYLSNSNGQIIAFVDPSVMKIKSLEKLKGNIIVQILQAVKLNVSDKDLNLKCAVLRGDITSGKINFPKGIAVDAKDFYLVANGTLNLGNDKIDIDLQPFSGNISDVNISSILGSLLKIKGTVGHPKISINQTETAKNVIGAIATAGAYNLGDKMFSADGAPCHTALKNTAYADHFKADTSVRGSVSNSYNSTQDAIKGLGKDIKNQTKEIKNQLKGLFGK